MNQIKFFKISETAKGPVKADGDMCYDIFADEDKHVQMGEIAVIKTGIKMSPPEGYHYSVRDRSGMAAKNGLHVVAGQIDNSYRGELLVAMTKLSISIYQIKKGDKIAQIKFEQDTTFPVVEVKSEEDLGYTNRGEKGFGSSGST